MSNSHRPRDLRRRSALPRMLPVLAVLALLLPAAIDSQAQISTAGAATTSILSLTPAGSPTVKDSFIESPSSISGDGRYVAFTSYDETLVPGTNASEPNATWPQVYVRDRATNTTVLASITLTGKAGNGTSEQPATSADGRFVAFVSNATNLVAGDTNGKRDLFVRDLQRNVTVRGSLSTGGAESDGDCYEPTISADGRFVAFYSYATNLVANDTNGFPDVFVRDLLLGITIRASVASGGAQGELDSFHPAISADGRFVAFRSSSTAVAPNRTRGAPSIFVHDRLAGTTEEVSVAADGSQADDFSFRPSISADGRYVAFESDATNLVKDDTNGVRDIFVRDRLAGITRLVSVSSSQAQSVADSHNPSISADGKFIAFDSYAPNLAPLGNVGLSNIFLRDLDNLTTELVSVSTTGAESDDDSFISSLSSDGRYVVFGSKASTLAPGNGDHARNVFLRDRHALERAPWIAATLPTPVAIVTPASPDGSAGWYRTQPLLSFSPERDTTVMIGFDNGTEIAYSAPIAVGDGRRSVTFYAVDSGGARSGTGRLNLSVDTLGPRLGPVTVEPVAPTVGEPALLGVTGEDPTSGLPRRASATLRVPGAPSSVVALEAAANGTFLGRFTPSVAGGHNATIVVFDVAGNNATRSLAFTVLAATNATTPTGNATRTNGTTTNQTTTNQTTTNQTGAGTNASAPTPGTVAEYSAEYEAETDHEENYTETRRAAEITGTPDTAYLAPTAGTNAYLQGTVPTAPSPLERTEEALVAQTPTGAQARFTGGGISHGIGGTTIGAGRADAALVANKEVNLSAVNLAPADITPQADAPGLVAGEKTLDVDGVEMWRRFSLLDGTLHTDIRTRLRAPEGDALRLTGEIVLEAPAGSWIATEEGGRIRALPMTRADGLTFAPPSSGNRWFAIYSPTTLDVAGVVLSGDPAAVTLRLEGTRVVLVPSRAGAGEVLSAEYLLAYRVSDIGATRYAGLMELARQDETEVGVAFIAPDRHGATGWAGSRADLDLNATGVEPAPFDQTTVTGTWRLTVDASSESAGKTLRTIMPASFMEAGGVEILLDGRPMSPLELGGLTDGATLIITFPIDHFSQRTVVIKTVLPGVPSFFLWTTLGLGLVAGGQSFLLGRITLRSRAAARGAGELARSEAVQRALGAPPGPSVPPGAPPTGPGGGPGEPGDETPAPPGTAGFKSETLRKMSQSPQPPGQERRTRYARCSSCNAPVVFDGGAATATCDRCGAQNVNEPT